MTTPPAKGPARPRFNWTPIIGLILGVIGFCVPMFLVEFDGLSPAGHRMFAIFILAIILWITEAVPMHATATLIILLVVLMLSDKSIMPLPADYKAIPFAQVFASLAHPVIILFLGGFFLAGGASKYELDKNLARVVLRPFGTSPAMVLLGLMLVTAVFSMFMSNTATTATMMAVALPVMMGFPKGDPMRPALALSIPIAANIGGIGTPIGTPPNAIALAQMSAQKVEGIPTFLQWTMGAVPFMLVFLAICWVILLVFFRSREKSVTLDLRGAFVKTPKAIVFYITFAGTVVLWMTEQLHGIDSNVVGFIPVVVLLCTRVFTVKDLQEIDWHVLWLVAGGIALGVGIGRTGMDQWFINLFPWQTMNPSMIVAMLALASLIMGTFISHSATANLLVPIGVALAMSPTVAISPVEAGVWIAIGSSLAMALPISTPPNAIAFATGEVKVKDMAIVGGLIGVITYGIFITVGPWAWRAMGILPATN